MNNNIFKQTDRAVEDNLKRLWRCDDLIMIGEYQHSASKRESEFGYISNPYINDRNIYYPENKHKRKVAIRVPKTGEFIEGHYYQIKAKLAPNELRESLNNPYLLVWDDSEPVTPVLDFLSPKEFIDYWFHKTGTTPKDASTIASQLKLNSLELYTQTERFIFELIQNADDMPSSNRGVSVQLHLLNNYLLFRHNGKFFDRDDVRAIADAAQSNKSENVRQTGYKGIGFKSVFTDSSCVYIRSGSYSFKFDKNDPIYSDFWSLYSSQIRLLANSPRDLEQFKIDFQKNKEKYESIDNIPWQIKPIWVNNNEFPEELHKSEFTKHAEVNIALNIGVNTIKSKNYATMIESILSKPKFILFLRNTVKFEYFNLESTGLAKLQSIELLEHDNLIDIIHNDQNLATFSKIHFDVEINNKEFNRAGFTIEKYEEKPGHYKFKDEFGEIKSIPDKLGMLSSTRITFASQIKNNEIVKLEKSQSILYNYLPTSDQRFGFPFLINADFITNTSREFILKENKWNHYLMFHIGKKCIECLSELSEIKDTLNKKTVRKYVRTYLDLLPETLLNEQDEELGEINKSFNRGFLSALNKVPYIINSLGLVKNSSDIILDITGISKVLGSHFFKLISETRKELPFFLINDNQLNKDYLDIEKYDSDKLVLQLQDNLKQQTLVNTLLKQDIDKFNRFLVWLNQFIYSNDIDSNWVLNLPIIRQGVAVICLREALVLDSFVFKTTKTQKVEAILQKVGFSLSEFSLDDENYKHIKGVILQQESYLKSDLGLYEHISSARGLNNLFPKEKNVLLTFFESLDEVGRAKYAKSLPLFKSKDASKTLKPLNSLISNTCKEIPDWLTDFVIDTEEEKALSTNFQGQLLKEKDLLGKLFCNIETYKEIITSINSKNIESFYSILLKLQKDIQVETTIDFSAIPWVFIEADSTFVMASSAYWPESITKLSVSKYASVKSIIETISDEQLSHFASLQVKAPFGLGSKDFKLLEVIPKENSFDVLPMNDFLDWAQANGEESLLSHFSISKLNDKYTLAKANGTLQYYTTDETLITFVETSILNTTLSLFPTELYTKDRNKISLLEGVPLLKYLIENGLATPDIAKFIQSAKDDELAPQYLGLLKEINIDTNQLYTLENDISRILKLSILHIVSDKEKLKNFRSKIIIDGHPLLERAISEDIFFYDKNIGIKTKLSELLPAYKDKTFPLSDIIAKFEGFDDNKNLIAILKDEGRTPKKILKELNELKVDYYNPFQTFFLSYYQEKYPDEIILEDKVLFTNFNLENLVEYQKGIHQFLDICLNENSYTGFIIQGIIPSFQPSSLILTDEYAHETEKIPHWLKLWKDTTDTENREAFVVKLGVNDAKSAVVLYRKAIMEAQAEPMNVNCALIDNDSLLINTLCWLSNQKNIFDFKIKKEVLQPLYQKLLNRKLTIDKILFPFLEVLNEDSYTLEIVNEDEELHCINNGWGDYEQEIFTNLVSTKKITDNVLPKIYRDDWKVIEMSFNKQPDTVKLAANSYLFDEEYYQEWDLKDKFKIQIYKGQYLPYEINYNNQVIKFVNEKYADCINQVYYVVENKKDSIIVHLEDVMELSTLNSLKIQKQNLIEQEKEAEKRIQFTEEESTVWKKLFGNEIPEDYYLDINLAACVSALLMLDKTDYDVSKAEVNLSNTHLFAQITPVYKNGSTEALTIMCRSAIGGILYLTAQAWDRLENSDILLFVKTGRKEHNYNFFHEKKDVLEISDTKYQVFRVEATSSNLTTDEILRGEFAKDKIWLILKMKENETYKSIFEGGIKRNEDSPDYNNINTAEDSPY